MHVSPRRLALASTGLACLLAAAPPPGALRLAAAETALDRWVKAPDPSFAWKIEDERPLPDGARAFVVRLTSQTWQGIPWRHWLWVVAPRELRHPSRAILLVEGGTNREGVPTGAPRDVLEVARAANATGSLAAVLFQVPNQPLLGGLHEDALIATTFAKYLETGDPTWPCLLPMTKSAVRAMDAVQAVAREKLSAEVTGFGVTGSSKRGWTTWLAGAVDSRVVAIAPRVIDTLDFPRQMELQRKSFGGYSEQIHDYTDRGLPELLGTPKAKALVDIVDPWSYRERFAMPKLIVLGTNDPYWPVDAASVYFDGLPGPKSLHYVPNAGHGLGAGAGEAIAAFWASVLDGKPLPAIEWEMRPEARKTGEADDAGAAGKGAGVGKGAAAGKGGKGGKGGGGGQAVLRVKAPRPLRAELWRATSATRDFRKARWSVEPLPEAGEGAFEARISLPEAGLAAVFARLAYPSPIGGEFALSTTIHVLGE